MSFTAYTSNWQHGQGTDENFNFQRQVDVFSGGHLIGVQEWSSAETGWNTPLTNGGYSQSIYRANQIGGSDGNRILYKPAVVTVQQTYERQLSLGATSPWDGGPTNVDKSAVAARCSVEGQQFYFVNTHLCQNAGADSNGALTSAIRENQIKALLAWCNNELLGLDILIAADFNYGIPNYQLNGGGLQEDLFTRAGFVDLWRDGIAKGIATVPWANLDATGGADQVVGESIITHDTRWIDSLKLRTVNRALTLTGISLLDTRANCSGALTGSPLRCPDVASGQLTGTVLDYGVRPFDHNPMAATFSVNQKACSPVRSTQFSWSRGGSLAA